MSKTYDLEDRTFEFVRDVRAFIRKVPKDISNIEDCKQVARSSGSVGANYIEANELTHIFGAIITKSNP